MESNEFSLEGLNELVKNAEQLKKDRERKKWDNITDIISGIARKYASKWYDEDDFRQDLWVKILKVIEDSGGIENVDESLIAKVAFNKAVDLYRYNRRRYDSKAQYIENFDNDADAHDVGNALGDLNAGDYLEKISSSRFEKGIDILVIKDIINRFEVGSRERKYVVLKLVNYGVIDLKFLDERDQKIFEKLNGDNEEDYIRSLGYKSHCPGSWTCKKREIERIIKVYLSC